MCVACAGTHASELHTPRTHLPIPAFVFPYRICRASLPSPSPLLPQERDSDLVRCSKPRQRFCLPPRTSVFIALRPLTATPRVRSLLFFLFVKPGFLPFWVTFILFHSSPRSRINPLRASPRSAPSVKSLSLSLRTSISRRLCSFGFALSSHCPRVICLLGAYIREVSTCLSALWTSRDTPPPSPLVSPARLFAAAENPVLLFLSLPVCVCVCVCWICV